MHHGHPARIPHVLQVVIKGTKLVHQHHSLVYDRPRAQGADIRICILFFKRPPQDVETPFKVRAGGDIRRTAHKALPDPRHGPPRTGAQLGRMTGHVTPAGHRDSFRLRQLLKDRARFPHTGFVFRQEEHADAVVAGLSQRDTFLLRPRREQRVREFRHDADAVPGRSGRVAARPVSQAFHNGQRLLHGAVGIFTFQVRHGAYAAAVMFQFFPVQRKLPVPHGCFRLLASAEAKATMNCELFPKPNGCSSETPDDLFRVLRHFHSVVHCEPLQCPVRFGFADSVPPHQQLLCLFHDLFVCPGPFRHPHPVHLGQHFHRPDHRLPRNRQGQSEYIR